MDLQGDGSAAYSSSTAGKWRARFVAERFEGLADEPRPGAFAEGPSGRPVVHRGACRTLNQATVDAYGDDEQLTGLFTMIEEHLAVPFTTTVLGVAVTVRNVDLTTVTIVAVCARGRHRQRIDLPELPLPAPPPDGATWIDAYRHWAGR